MLIVEEAVDARGEGFQENHPYIHVFCEPEIALKNAVCLTQDHWSELQITW